MALIELNLEKPALKRTEIIEGREESPMRSVDVDDGIDDVDTMDGYDASETDYDAESYEMDDFETAEDAESKKSGRGRRIVRRAAMVGAMTGAAVAARKLRARRKKSSEQTQVDEDWQTAND